MSEEHDYTLRAAVVGTEATLWIICSCGWEHEMLDASATMEDLNKTCLEHNPYIWPWNVSASECPNAPHRGPEGPNEDLAQCGQCWAPSFAMRPWGETYGEHLDDCSLPVWHESYCQPGGSGHPPAKLIRG